jgi:hypothetical protein
MKTSGFRADSSRESVMVRIRVSWRRIVRRIVKRERREGGM